MINRVVLVGRLTKDPELRYTPSGVATATFTLAVNRAFANQQGEREADFINCVVWRKQAENVANYLRKGSLAGVEGRIQTRNYEGQDGRRVYVTEVVADSVQFLEPRGNSQPRDNMTPPPSANGFGGQAPQNNPFESQPNQNVGGGSSPFGDSGKVIDISDDDLPF